MAYGDAKGDDSARFGIRLCRLRSEQAVGPRCPLVKAGDSAQLTARLENRGDGSGFERPLYGQAS